MSEGVLPVPYFEQPHLGPIHAFGVLVAIAVFLGMRVLRSRAIHEGLDPELALRLVGWVLIGGFVGAHLVHVFVYFPEETLEDPLVILKFWEGISSFGGFAGAVLTLFVFTRRHEMRALPVAARWRHFDAIAYAFVMGWVFGRAGCAVAFDHPGVETDFFLGFTNARGEVRHNLGLYEGLYFVPLTLLFHGLGRRPRGRPPGFFVGLLAIVYAPVRFGLDFLRQVDVRYLGLTPAQWGCFAVAGAGLFVIWRARSLEASET